MLQQSQRSCTKCKVSWDAPVEACPECGSDTPRTDAAIAGQGFDAADNVLKLCHQLEREASEAQAAMLKMIGCSARYERDRKKLMEMLGTVICRLATLESSGPRDALAQKAMDEAIAFLKSLEA